MLALQDFNEYLFKQNLGTENYALKARPAIIPRKVLANPKLLDSTGQIGSCIYETIGGFIHIEYHVNENQSVEGRLSFSPTSLSPFGKVFKDFEIDFKELEVDKF